MVYELYDYQIELIDGITKSIHRGNNSLVVQSPAGSGKSATMAEIAKRATDKNNRVLLFTHRKEIIDQMRKTFEAQGVDMQLVQMGNVQSLSRNLAKLYPAKIVMVDEAHRTMARSYLKILDNFPDALKLLFTATPIRLDGKGFDEVATDIVLGKQVKWLIENNRLAPFTYYAPPQIDTSQLKIKSTGDYDTDSITQALRPKIYGNVVEHYKEYAADTQAFLYAHNVEAAQKFANEFNSNGITAASVDGKTPKDKRDKIMADFKDGKIKVLTNAELFLEGVDAPDVETVMQVRPTTSLAMYIQFAMRSMRYKDGKQAIILDFVGNVGRFGLPDEDREWTLEGKDKRTRKLEAAQRQIDNPIITCDACFGTFYKKEMVDNVCPYCGEPYTTKTITYETDETAKLRKVLKSTEKQKRIDLVHKMMADEIAMNVANKQVSDLKSIEELEAYAKINGYKPGWVYHQAKQKRLLKGK